MKIRPNIKISGISGFGPAAWDRDTEKVSMHSPIPGHVDHEEHLEQQHHHHLVHRRDPEHDSDENLGAMDLPLKSWLPLLEGKDYILIPEDKLPAHSIPSNEATQQVESHQAEQETTDGHEEKERMPEIALKATDPL